MPDNHPASSTRNRCACLLAKQCHFVMLARACKHRVAHGFGKPNRNLSEQFVEDLHLLLSTAKLGKDLIVAGGGELCAEPISEVMNDFVAVLDHRVHKC